MQPAKSHALRIALADVVGERHDRSHHALSRPETAHAAGRLRRRLCRRRSAASAAWKMPALLPSCSTRCSKSSCGRKSWSSIIICPPALKVSPSPSPSFPQASEFRTRPGGLSRAHPQGQRSGRHSDHRQPERRHASAAGQNSQQQIEQAGADAIECNIYYIPDRSQPESG